MVSDIRASEIQDRKRVLYSYWYLRGSYEIEADLTSQLLQHAIRVVVSRPSRASGSYTKCDHIISMIATARRVPRDLTQSVITEYQ